MLIDSLRRGAIDPYQLLVRVDLRQPIAPEVVGRAFSAVVGRHRHLRARPILDGAVSEWLPCRAGLPVAVVDLPCQVDREEEDDVLDLMDRERSTPLDLEQPPLMRLAIVRRPGRSTLLWTFHHALLDTRGIVEFLKEVFAEFDHGAPSGAGESEHELLLRQALAVEGRGGPASSFWGGYLSGFSEPSILAAPIERGSASPSGRYDFREICLRAVDEADVEPLQALATAHGVSATAIVQAAWSVVLAWYGGTRDVVFGATRACRREGNVDFSRFVGLTLNTVAVRARLRSEDTLLDLIRQRHADWRAMREHQRAPLGEVKGAAELPLGAELFDTLVNFDLDVNAQLRAHHPAWRERDVQVLSDVPYSWALSALQMERGWLLRVSYDPLRYTKDFVARALGHVAEALRVMARAPETPLDAVDLFAPDERARLAGIGRGEESEPLSEVAAIQRFEGQVLRRPEAAAIRFGGQVWTYRALNERAEALAARLRPHCPGEDTLVGLCVGRTPHLVAAMLAVHKVGAGYVPLDPKYPRDRLQAILHESRVDVTLTDEGGRAILGAERADIVLLDVESPPAAAPESPTDRARRDLRRLSHVIYTSGSTGVPKGVAIEQRSVSALLDWSTRVFSAAELRGVLFSTSMCFDLSVFEVFAPLAVGGAVILAENALALPELPERDEVTLVNTVPSAAAELVRAGGIPRSVRTINLAGEALRRELVARLYEGTEVERIYNLYGPTEDTTYSTWALVGREEEGEPTIGRPLDHSSAYILDSRRRLVPRGVKGELYLGGAGLARGYLHREDLTAERFVDVRIDGELRRLYRTGDAASFGADGALRYHGRLDFQVKLRGFRIELGEIEAHLERAPAVRQAVAMVTGEGAAQMLVAWVEAPLPSDVDEGALRRHLEGALPSYMVPGRIVVLDAFPLTVNGKVDRKRLPPPGPERGGVGDDPPSAGEIEETLLSIWSEVLGTRISSIRRSFFDCGGNSLLLARVCATIKCGLGRAVSMMEVLRHPTIESLATYLRERDLVGPCVDPERAAPERARPAARAETALARLRGLVGAAARRRVST